MKLRVVSLSKMHKSVSDRSKFFSKLMKKLAGDKGNEICGFFVKRSKTKFRESMHQIIDELIDEM